MLLMVLVSYLLRRRFQGKRYVILVFVVTVLVSFFSTGYGWKIIDGSLYTTLPPLPFSFPFLSILDSYLTMNWDSLHFVIAYDVYFVTIWITRLESSPLLMQFLLVPAFSFFLLVNIIGAIIGYWIKVTRAIEKITPI